MNGAATALPVDDARSARAYVIFVAIGYSIASSSLSIINKVRSEISALHSTCRSRRYDAGAPQRGLTRSRPPRRQWALLEFPFAACLTALQFLASALVVLIAARVFKVIECEPLEWAKVRAFSPAVLLFYVSIFCNTKLLQHATVDTFIVFRSCTPLLVLPIETMVIRTKTGEAAPTARTYLSLLFIAASSLCYVFVERGGITLTSYFWGAVYLVAIVVDMVVVKKVVTDGASAPPSAL